MDERLKRAIAERVVELFQMVPDPCPPSVKQLVADIDTGNSSDVEEEFQQKVARVLADPAIDWDAMQKILEARAPNDLLTRPRLSRRSKPPGYTKPDCQLQEPPESSACRSTPLTTP